MDIKLILYSLFLIYNNLINICNAITLKSVALTYTEEYQVYSNIVKEFNKYAKRKNIDVELDINLYTTSNSSFSTNDYGSTIEYLLSKGSTKYDIFFYDSINTPTLSKYFVDLKKWLGEDHINLYSSELISKLCSYDNKLVGLPIYIDYSILYANTELLKQYNKNIPKTWDELLETASYIYKKEKEKGNNDIIGETKESKTPEFDSTEAIKALNKLKELKNELLIDDINTTNYLSIYKNLLLGNAIFLKFWYIHEQSPVYTKLLLGNKEGISGSCVGGYNIGINDHISTSRKILAMEVVKFITSQDTQKNFMLNKKILSGITNLYDNEKICNLIDCNLIKDIQPVYQPNTLDNYDDFSSQFKEYIYDFLNNNGSASEALNNINNIIKFHTIDINPKKSPEGFSVLILMIIISIIMLHPLLYIFNEKYKSNFKFLSKDLWIVTLIGIFIMLSYIITEYRLLTIYKCQYRIVALYIGYLLSMIPSFFKLVVNFPENNKYSKWVKLYGVQDKYIYKGKNFKVCKVKNSYGYIIFFLAEFEILLAQCSMALLVFIEWNIKSTEKDMKLIQSTLMIDIILLIIYYSIRFVNFYNYKAYFLFYSLTTVFLVISKYIFMFGLRIIRCLDKTKTIHSYIENEMSEFKSTVSYVNNNISRDDSIITDIRPSISSRNNSLIKVTFNNINRRNSTASAKLPSKLGQTNDIIKISSLTSFNEDNHKIRADDKNNPSYSNNLINNIIINDEDDYANKNIKNIIKNNKSFNICNIVNSSNTCNIINNSTNTFNNINSSSNICNIVNMSMNTCSNTVNMSTNTCNIVNMSINTCNIVNMSTNTCNIVNNSINTYNVNNNINASTSNCYNSNSSTNIIGKNSNNSSSNNIKEKKTSKGRQSVLSKVINYHYATNIENGSNESLDEESSIC
ncbi:hypothetical protein PIROE2DRAFT_8898 [Piromyces sp. E2]|nr:hypothetical protein PIROE2DRAFT_8898 [Piromyces sp. E2]|eukprot:OUM64345.1 hypothetical protein PIROE2DRAFT_8898 [Piromyces sp. E2]